MDKDSYAVYAQFLIQCRQVMGPFDFDRLAHDHAYKTDFYNRVMLSADDRLFEMADQVNRQLNEESTCLN